MSRVDRINRSLELKIVFWGPAQSGKTTALRSLHGACDARRRGEFASISGEHGRDTGGACAFDYVPLELPRFRDYELRVDCYTVPGFAGYEATRRRLLRGADGVVFVADVSPEGVDGNVESWQALDRLLRVAEADDTHPIPVVALANKHDVDGARDEAYLRAQLMTSCGRRALLDASVGVAGTGEGVVRAFRKVVVAAAARALEPLEAMHLTGGGFDMPIRPDTDLDDAFLAALAGQFESLDDGVSVEEAVPGRTVSVETAAPAPRPAEPDAQERPAEAPARKSAWGSDLDRRERRREAALGRLLVDVANACASATDDEGAARSVLIQLVMNLDAVSGWVGLADAGEGEVIYDPMGRARDAASVAEAAQALSMGLLDDNIIPVGAAATAGFPGGAAGGRGVFLQFMVSGSEPGWLLLVGGPGRGLPSDAEPAIRTAAAILGLTVARLHALDQLRALNRALEQKVTDRTAQLQQEKVTLEDRVRDRTRQLEKAKRAALETERMLFDRGRTEGVRQVAAGLAHELNNPLSAVSVNLKFALELLEDGADKSGSPEWFVELREAVMDAASEAEQAAQRVSTLFARDVAATRRAAVRTNLRHAVLEAVEHFHQVYPQSPFPEVVGAADVTTGIQRAELTRWVFRILGGVTTGAQCGALVRVEEGPDGPHLTLDLDGPTGTGASDMLAAIAQEVQRAGGRLDAEVGARRCRIEVLLPPALGGRGTDHVWERSA